MNLVGHLVVAARAGHPEPVQMGAVLPDALHLIGARTPSDLPQALADGVSMHYRTDEAFHHDPYVVAEMAKLRERLATVGVPRGPARAAAHIAWEMMLDGVLVELGWADSWPEAWRHADAVLPSLDSQRHAHWRELQDHTATMTWPMRYTNQAWVADRVVAICARRPRLALDVAADTLADLLEPPTVTDSDALVGRILGRLAL